jgi:UDPglucose--hexose-1-phosphate uridylyltransferase
LYRQDPITKKWVIFAPHRAKRPRNSQIESRPILQTDPNCPFCSGPEAPDRQVFQLNGGKNGWQQYVLANKFPSVQSDLEPERHKDKIGRLAIEGFGISEVIVESPLHYSPLEERNPTEIRNLFRLYKDRATERFRDPRVTQVIIFKNCGSKAGASQPHPHSQVYALPIVPGHIRFETDCHRRLYDDEGFCPVCETIEREIKAGSRIALENSRVVAICPYASENSYEVHLFPVQHFTSITLINDLNLDAMADATQIILKSLKVILGPFDYNLVWDSAPKDDCDAPFFHLRLRIIPRLATPAGFEMASQMSVNPILPEKAAKQIKNAIKKGIK